MVVRLWLPGLCRRSRDLLADDRAATDQFVTPSAVGNVSTLNATPGEQRDVTVGMSLPGSAFPGPLISVPRTM
jgi:hypothetical protein